MRYKILIAFLFFGLATFGQQITIVAKSSNPNPETGENFQIDYYISSSVDLSSLSVSKKPVTGLKYISEGQSGLSQEFVVINGNMTMQQKINYSVVYLAEKAGEYLVPPLEIIAGGKTYKSNSVKIIATAADQNKIVRNEKYYFEISSTKKSVYVGEPLALTVKYYSQSDINGLPRLQLELKGFYKKELEVNNNYTIKSVNGKPHIVGTLKQYVIYPLEAGLKVIPKASGTMPTIQARGFSARVVEEICYSNPISINVKPLPENGKPATFNNAVGSFTIISKVDKTKVKTNDAISYKITIKGSGNINIVSLPAINFPEDFEVYDPKISENITTDASGMSGEKNYEYILIPKEAGTLKIPAIEFSYFNPANSSYQKTSTSEITIQVEQGSGGSASTYVKKEDLKFAKKDIHYFSVDTLNLEAGEKTIFLFSALFWILLLLAPTATVLILIIKRERNYNDSEIISSKNKNAARLAAKRLKQAEKELQNNDSKAFYGEVLKAMNSYFSDKFNIPTVNLSKEIIAEELRKKGVSELTIQETMSIIEKCEMARYAPVNDPIGDIYSKALQQITKIES
ncbi:MAG: BatD family protein [Bacteroidetes bacterium]|nr:BatD family protein [Bacteroidota bacterium]